MKKLIPLIFLMFTGTVNAQLLTWTPKFIQESSSPIEIVMDANYGNKGLKDYTPNTDVYVHVGAITNKSTSSSDWKHVPFTWATTNATAQCTYLGNNKWKYTITGGLRTFFSITDPTENVKKIAILFRNGAGTLVQRNADNSDMYVPVYDNGLYVRIDEPYRQPTYNPIPEPLTKKIGDALTVTANASQSTSLKLYFNGNVIGTATGTTISATTNITTSGNQQIIAEATGSTVTRDTLNFVVTPANNVADLPAGAVDGINYEPGDTSVILVLFAPDKTNVFVVGDFNNWATNSDYLMNVTPDAARYWIRLKGLTPGTEYAYQYLIDGKIKVADYNTEKVLDPDNDKYIPATTYPGLKAYPTGKTSGIVSVLQTAKPKFSWQANSYVRPDKRNLVIYELLVRDFISAQNYQTLKDSISYFKKLGINAIELMPINEFEGNISWGYNPSFYFAPDKYYGTENALKQFIDECHKNGIAVIMDIALNHSFYLSPMVQMYWDNSANRPAANSPWFNPVPKHAFNVGFDINHESAATQEFVNRVINHWLKNYKIDGFRWDLSKGFTQKQTCDASGNNCDVGSWSAYDASRIAIWKKYNGYMQAASANSYCILEHFADNAEEKELADNGMMPWGNLNYNYNQATKGYNNGSDFSWGVYTARGWTNPYLVTYQESHDEERIQYRNETEGNSIPGYNVRDTAIGLKRDGMAAAFWSMQPGPKLMWQFGEVGYDYSINRCQNGTISNDCRLDVKPTGWAFFNNPNRKGLVRCLFGHVKVEDNAKLYFNVYLRQYFL